MSCSILLYNIQLYNSSSRLKKLKNHFTLNKIDRPRPTKQKQTIFGWTYPGFDRRGLQQIINYQAN